MKVLIIGAGGHGQVVANIMLLGSESNGREAQPIGFLDDNPRLQQYSFLGLRVVGTVAQLPLISHDAVIVGIGDNRIRRKIFRQLQHSGEEFVRAVHPSAIIGAEVKIGSGTVISPAVVVNPGSRIGSDVILNTGCTIDHHNSIDDHAHIAPGVHLGGDVEVGEGALIGIGATVMPQCRIGAGSIIGAGAVVIRNVPPHTTVIGVPARPIKTPSPHPVFH